MNGVLAFIYWSVPPDNPATSYDVRYSTNNSSWSNPIRTNSAGLNYTLTGLADGVGYCIQVRTVNGPQVSGYTQMAGTVIPACLPSPPTGVTGVSGNN